MPREKRWSLGFAYYDHTIQDCHPESSRAIFTAMSAAAHHPLVAEVVIVNNNPLPNSPLPGFARKMGNCRYVEFPEPQGTSAPRNQVFREATYPRVACIDSHVLLLPGFFEALNAFYGRHGWDCPDLLHGPMMEEDLKTVHGTHMNDQWRDAMWGTWGWAWQHPTGFMFSTSEDSGRVKYLSLDPAGEQAPLSAEDYGLPSLTWEGHEVKLEKRGCVPCQQAPFVIPGHGMGFFACRKDSWLELPFSDRCRGFGGEEMTTHRRFRLAGRRAWCVPGARWWHHYGRAGQSTFQGPGHHAPAPYPMTLRDRVRNYAIEFLRNGDDLAPVARHFNSSVMELKLLAKSEC